MPVNSDILKELRRDKGYTQQILARRFGISRATYANYEAGNRRMPIAMLEILADELGTSTDYILGRTAMTKPYPPRTARENK